MALILCLLWLAVYIRLICVSLFRYKEINGAIELLTAFLNSATVKQTNFYESYLVKKENYNENLSRALSEYPMISHYTSLYCDPLKYGVSDEQNYNAAINLYNDLAMKSNYIFEDFKSSLNPLKALKALFSLPGSILSWFGLPQKLSFSKILNLLCWGAAYILGLYSSEIKAMLDSFFNNLV